MSLNFAFRTVLYIGESATCHNVMCRLDPHKTSMLSVLNSARLFSLQPATSLSRRPACSLSSRPPLRAHREARPSWRHRRGRVSRPWKGGARSRCWHQPEPNHWWVFLRLVLYHVTCVCFVGQGHKVMPWYQHTDIYKSLTFAIGRELYISVSQLRAIMLCPITEKPIYINVFEFCILQRIIYIGESATCHNVMSRHLHTNIYKCLLIL